MDRRSWLWRRKSSEKSPGETESSESLSPMSERFSDEQAFVNSQVQSPELTSKDNNNNTPSEDELRELVRTLGEKLSAAIENIRAKEELVKQHSKVAEEAVLGWENAETEVMNLKQKLELETNKVSTLEDRVGQLDGALKECLRQLRQAKEEQQEQKIHEDFTTKAFEWEFVRSELETQILELQTQLQSYRESTINPESSEITHLKIELQEQYEELEIRTIERDLNAQAAEAASKQNLDSIKKVYKLEAEIRRLKATIRKGALGNDQKSVASSSLYVESFTDSQSDIGERLLALENEKLDDFEATSNHDSWASALIQELDQFKNEKSLNSTGGINLMDDFLEMERLAALPEKQNDKESSLKTEMDALIEQNAELKEKLEKVVMEKTELEIAFAECRDQLKTTLDKSMETEKKVMKLEVELLMAIEATNSIKNIAETKLASAESEIKDLSSKLRALEEKLKKERLISTAVEAKCQKLQDEISRLTSEAEVRNAETKLASAESEIKDLSSKLRALEEKLKKERLISTAIEAKCQKLQDEISRLTSEAEVRNAETKLASAESEIKDLSSKLRALEEKLKKERLISTAVEAKCQKLQDEISRLASETEVRNAENLKRALKIKQDKELEVAVMKFTDCQRTIASLGRQLKSLGTLEDYLIDSSEKVPPAAAAAIQLAGKRSSLTEIAL
ncbi:filament-like plant protein 3 [Impatiens glandulifera]|uniref:filament-like plant protein 3 n=1 Tax=Impatiens glandulifera TaxID=253017 RepID=UPI001FB06F3B|nr:filament-like plant protein 3 [Impatiens glandulifera]XP_047317074.1 filament-like plant protein 3 [Impatiens glandulifera]